MMTEMTRYRPQTDLDDDDTSAASFRTDDMSAGTTQVHYHMGSNWWRQRTVLEKTLLVGCFLLLLVTIVLVIVLHFHNPILSYVLRNHTVLIPHIATSDGSTVMCLTRDCIMKAGLILSSMNFMVDPCEDFYEYACGGWILKNPVPEGKAEWGTLSKLIADNQIILRSLVESKEKAFSRAEEMTKIFYSSCIDNNGTIESLEAKPLLEILELDQGGLTLPARDYYLNESEKAVADAYIEYMTKVGMLLGAPENLSRSNAQGIFEVEKMLANFTTPDEDRRDDSKLYNLMKLENLTQLAPVMDWTNFVNRAMTKINKQIDSEREVVVYAPEFLAKLASVIKTLNGTEEGIIKLHNYLMWHVAKNFISFLSRDFRDAAKVLEKAQVGVSGSEETWRECVAATDMTLGPALGALFVRKTFSKESKLIDEQMLDLIRQSFIKSIQNLTWMDKETQEAALDKAAAIGEMIGYPSYILNPPELDEKFRELEIKEDEFFANNLRVNEFRTKENLNKIFKPVNKSQWDMTPSTVNAYYSPTRNNIVIPAGILQAPFYDSKNPFAINFGSVGVVMGHELTHAFDDQGMEYDKNGDLNSWWKNETVLKFKERSQCMIDQYSKYEMGGEHLNGKLTLGENIADNGGLKASYRAYQEWVKTHGHDYPLPGINLNDNQLFFLGFGQVWCSSITDKAAHLEILKDSHVPAKFRVLGTLSNNRDFAEAFNCPDGARMNPSKKCEVW